MLINNGDILQYRIMMGWFGLLIGIKPTVIFHRNELLQFQNNRRISRINEEGDDTTLPLAESSMNNQFNFSESSRGSQPQHSSVTVKKLSFI